MKILVINGKSRNIGFVYNNITADYLQTVYSLTSNFHISKFTHAQCALVTLSIIKS